jgi:hypothetical protein
MLGGNYICYRLYCFYKKHKWSAYQADKAFMLMWVIYFIYIAAFAIFISGFLCNTVLTKDNFSTVLGGSIIVGAVVNSVFTDKKYNEKRIAALEKKYRKDWRNSMIANWMLILIIPLYIITHVVIVIFIFKLLSGRL